MDTTQILAKLKEIADVPHGNEDILYAELEMLISELEAPPAAPPLKKRGRRASDPQNDADLLTEHEKGATLDELANASGVSRQSVCKAINRAKARQTAKVVSQTPAGPYTPTSDDVRTASKLLFGNSDRGTIDEIKQKIKKNL